MYINRCTSVRSYLEPVSPPGDEKPCLNRSVRGAPQSSQDDRQPGPTLIAGLGRMGRECVRALPGRSRRPPRRRAPPGEVRRADHGAHHGHDSPPGPAWNPASDSFRYPHLSPDQRLRPTAPDNPVRHRLHPFATEGGSDMDTVSHQPAPAAARSEERLQRLRSTGLRERWSVGTQQGHRKRSIERLHPSKRLRCSHADG